MTTSPLPAQWLLPRPNTEAVPWFRDRGIRCSSQDCRRTMQVWEQSPTGREATRGSLRLWSRVAGPRLLITRSRSRPAGAHSACPRLGPRSASNLVLAARRYDYANGGAVIRIVDFTHGTAGPYASMLLAFAFSQLYEKGRALSRRPWRVISCVCSTGNAPPPEASGPASTAASGCAGLVGL